jgi:hypothetical protein
MSLEASHRRWTVRLAAIWLAYLFLAAPASAQTLVAIPDCGVAGKTKVCVTGSGWAEPAPPCFYRFYFDGTQVVFPDQPDGLFGPPNRSFVVPPGAAMGNHTVTVDLRLSSDSSLIQTKTIPYKVVGEMNSTATTETTTFGGQNAIRVKFDPGSDLKPPCKKVVFIQTIRRFAVKQGETDDKAVITRASDWKTSTGATCIPDAAKKDAVETDPGRRRVDQVWAVPNPYYFAQNPTPDCDSGFHKTGCLCKPKDKIQAVMLDAPTTPGGCFPSIGGVATDKAILRFEVAVFCAAGEPLGGSAEGEYLGKVITWEHHQRKDQAGTIQNAVVSSGSPSAEFLLAVANWVTAKGFSLPMPKPSPCP